MFKLLASNWSLDFLNKMLMPFFLLDFRIKRYELLKKITLAIWPILDTQCQLWAKSQFGTCWPVLSMCKSKNCNLEINYIICSVVYTIICTYRVTHKGCDFSDDIKLLKSSNLKRATDLFLSWYHRGHLQKKIASLDTVSEWLQSD